MASMLRFVVALSPIMLLAMALLARWRPVFVVSLLGLRRGGLFLHRRLARRSGCPLSSPAASRPWRGCSYSASCSSAAFELHVTWLALHPAVDADYRAYYIDQTTTCLDKPVSGTLHAGHDGVVPAGRPGRRAALAGLRLGWPGRRWHAFGWHLVAAALRRSASRPGDLIAAPDADGDRGARRARAAYAC